ncbi:MAG TPA: hypothetical protein DF383_02565 [Deltaproteobacteria bacterium]|nr:hypothetical protein [Deltaproteobacteria bacterium]
MANYISDDASSGLGGINPRSLALQARNFNNTHDPIGTAKFDKALSIASGVMEMAGPALSAAAPFMGLKGAAITGAAVSAFQGQGGISTPGYSGGGFVGYNGKSLSMPGTAPGYPGSAGGVGGASGIPGMPGAGGGDMGAFDSQINAMMNSNLSFLALQSKVQNISTTINMLTNTSKTDHETRMAAIRNIRT